MALRGACGALPKMAALLPKPRRLVHAALDAGITFLDTADIYGFNGVGGFGDAEALLGEVLAAEPALRSAHGAGEQRRDHAAFAL